MTYRGLREHWRSITAFVGGLSDRVYLVVIALATGLVTAVLVADGGPPSALIQFYYGPVLIAAIRFQVRGGLVSGALCGVCAGPLAFYLAAPYEAAGGALPLHWLLRSLWLAAVGGAIGAAIQHARTLSSTLRFHLYTDPTTALPNLAAARRHLGEMAARLSVHGMGRHLTVTALRVTNYDSLASAFGQHFAQLVVRRMVQSLQPLLPPGTYLARTAKDTFTALSTGTQEEQAATFADVLFHLEKAPVLVQGVPVYVSYAAGLASAPADASDLEQLFTHAEAAVSEAVNTGSNLALHDPAAAAHRSDSVRLLGELGSAIRSGQLMLAYQPRLDLHTMRIAGVEALARWHHPKRGWIPPGRFAPLVEETRLIGTFSQWVLRQALSQTAAWLQDGLQVTTAVNISAHNLADEWLFDQIETLLEEFGVPPSALELEITESAFMQVTNDRLDRLQRIRDRGMRIAIDDFGTGYASLAYLRSLPVDLLKLDKSFIQDGLGKPLDHLMVQRIVQMARDRALRVVAEGVESASVLQTVRNLGCDEAQGFYIARPMLAEQAGRVLLEGWRSRSRFSEGF